MSQTTKKFFKKHEEHLEILKVEYNLRGRTMEILHEAHSELKSVVQFECKVLQPLYRKRRAL